MKLTEERGFTLLEVLTAAAIMLIVCGFVLKISSQVLDTWGRVSENSEGKNEMRLVLDVIERDLETSLPYYWTYSRSSKGELENIGRFSFYGYGETNIPNAIAYEIGYDEIKGKYGIYRCVKKGNRKYDITEKLEEVMSPVQVSSKEIIRATNLLARNVSGIAVKFFYRDSHGKIQSIMRAPFEGTLICVDVVIMGEKIGEEFSRRISLVGVEKL